MARIILNREEVEEAVKVYVRDKFMQYGDGTEIHVTQERKVSCVISFGEKTNRDRTTSLPGLNENEETVMEDLTISDPRLDDDEEDVREPMHLDKTEDNVFGVK